MHGSMRSKVGCCPRTSPPAEHCSPRPLCCAKLNFLIVVFSTLYCGRATSFFGYRLSCRVFFFLSIILGELYHIFIYLIGYHLLIDIVIVIHHAQFILNYKLNVKKIHS